VLGVVSGLAAALLLGAAGLVVLQRHLQSQLPPAAAPVDVFATLFDTRPVTVTITALWQKAPLEMPRWQFLADHHIWLRMNFEDWDRLPNDLRAAGLERLLARHGDFITDPARWPAMTAADWDAVPQPVRAMAFVEMIDRWADFYRPGEAFGLDPYEVAQTIKAVALSESWLDHRGWAANADGSTDIGLGAASNFARDAMRRLFAEQRVEFPMSDADYFNPRKATRWLVFWFGLMIDEARGDLHLAVRAHNCGISQARRGCGQEYLEHVLRRRERYFAGPSGSPTWRALSEFRRVP
jgi:hypothetical protein